MPNSKNNEKNNEENIIGDKFLYVKGSTRLEEVEVGKVKCGGCLRTFSRIISHLTNSKDCGININMDGPWMRDYLRKRFRKNITYPMNS